MVTAGHEIDFAAIAFAAILIVSAARDRRAGRTRLAGGWLPRHEARRSESPLAFRLAVLAKAGTAAVAVGLALLDLAGS